MSKQQDKHKSKNKGQSSEGIKDPKLAAAVESNQLDRDEALEAEAKKEKVVKKADIEKVEGHTPMVFTKEVFYNDLTKPEYGPGEVYQVPNHMVQRWIKRGGLVVDESLDLEKALAKSEAPQEEKLDLDKDQGDNKDIE